LAERLYPGSAALEGVRALIDVTDRHGLPPANVDLALAGLCRAMDCLPGAAEVVFTVARLAGWLAHTAEEYARRTDLRLRAILIIMQNKNLVKLVRAILSIKIKMATALLMNVMRW
jgi:citrate synthase